MYDKLDTRLVITEFTSLAYILQQIFQKDQGDKMVGSQTKIHTELTDTGKI